MQQGGPASAAAAGGGLYDVGPTGGGDAGDAVMARWLQSAGLQHLASPLASADQRFMPNVFAQGYGAQTAEDKQKMFKLMRNLNFGGDMGSESHALPSPSFAGGGGSMDGFYSPELRGEFGAGLLDLHAVDDTELLSEHVMSEPFEASPFMAGSSLEDDSDTIPVRPPQRAPAERISTSASNEKEPIPKESNVAKIKVVVRKRPLNRKEISRKEDDIVSVPNNAYLTVYEPKLKVDLTAYVEKHEFCFDAVLDEHVNNDEVYRSTVEPIIPTIFQRTKATCFAYGQTGSGKTYTMQPLPLRAVEDIVRLLRSPTYRNQRLKLWLSYFEIYGGKLFDLLCDRRKLCMREDGKQQVCIVGLQEFEVFDVQIVKEFIEKGNAARSTGSTGANEESSRSHAILQLSVKKHYEVPNSRRPNDAHESKSKVVGKISFIDLAGSERGADTTDNDRQTRIEGAEINKSLLALKECIRALDNDQIHIPFRGSKLTEVLRDSFVGNSRTVMISCISPNAGSCEHTLNTLRYADRVKSLSKSGNPKKDQGPPLPTSVKESSSYSVPVEDTVDSYEQNQEAKARDVSRESNSVSNNSSTRREESAAAFSQERDMDMRNNVNFATNRFHSSSQNSFESLEEEKVEKVTKVSSPRRKVAREDKSERQRNLPKKESSSEFSTNHKQPIAHEPTLNSIPRQIELEASCSERDIDAMLEEEDALIAGHRKEIEDTMEIVREEMKLLAEIDQPGSSIDNYVTQLNFVLSRKAAGLVSLQARLARFQHRLKEQEILSKKKVPR